MACSSLVTTCKCILTSGKSNPELLSKIEDIIFPMVVNTLTPDGLEGMDEALEGMTLIMYHTNTVSNKMWSLFPQMLKIVIGTDDEEGGYAFDYLTGMEDYMRGLIWIGDGGMLVKKVGEIPVLTLFIKSIIKILQIGRNDVGDLDGYVCVSLICGLLEQFRGKIDGIIPLFLKILISELSNKEISKCFRLHVLQIISYLFLYNAKKVVEVLQASNVLIPVGQNYFSSLRKYTEVEQFRNLIYGITSLISLNIEDLPDVIKQGMNKILESLIKLMHKYTKERERELIEDIEDKLTNETITEESRLYFQEVLAKLREIVEGNEENLEEEEDDKKDEEELEAEYDDYLWSRNDSNYYRSSLQGLEAPLFFRDVFK